jgi:predicted Zn-dependent protease
MLKYFLSLILLLGCASKTSDRYREGDNKGQKSALTVEEEKKLTKEALSEMKKDYPPVDSPRLQTYINRIGQKIVGDNDLYKNPYIYTFTVVESAQVNAFALPAGSVFITTALIAMADSEAEIAGVLGHEIGHVTARHTAERMYVSKKEQGRTWMLAGIGAAIGATAGYFLSDKLCAKGDSGCRSKYLLYGAGGGAGAGLLVQKYGFMKNSQEDELESDRIGFRYAVNAGYDKNKVGDFYSKLLKMEEQAKQNQGANPLLGWAADALSSHPPSRERVKQANEMKSVVQSKGAIVSSSEFPEMKRLATDFTAKAKAKNN